MSLLLLVLVLLSGNILSCTSGEKPGIQGTSPASGRPSSSPVQQSTPSPSPSMRESGASPTSTPSAPSPSPSAPTVASADENQTQPNPVPIVPDRVIVITADTDKAAFQPQRIDVYVGQIVQVIFVNNAAPASGRLHNWVLVKPHMIQSVAALGKEAGVDPDAVTYSPAILASTHSAAPGRRSDTTFIAPDHPGQYPYISTVGDEWTHLKGVLIVHPLG